MGFRVALTTATAVNTASGSGAGVKITQQNSSGISGGVQGVISFNDGIAGDTPATITSTPGEPTGRSVAGGVFELSGGAFSNGSGGVVAGPKFQANVENTGGTFGPVARVRGAPLVVDQAVTAAGVQLGQGANGTTRTTGVVGLPVPAGGTASPAGAALTLPALPAGTIVVVDLATQFYCEGTGAPQTCKGELVLNSGSASRISGLAAPGLSMSSLIVTAHTIEVWQVTGPAGSSSALAFGSSYTAGPGSPRAILQREDWTAWLP